jgi:hypothetical protein
VVRPGCRRPFCWRLLIPAASSRVAVLVAMQYPGSFGQHETEFTYPVQ